MLHQDGVTTKYASVKDGDATSAGDLTRALAGASTISGDSTIGDSTTACYPFLGLVAPSVRLATAPHHQLPCPI